MAEAIPILIGAFGFFSALTAEETPASFFPSFAVVSSVGVDEIGVEAFLIGPAPLRRFLIGRCLGQFNYSSLSVHDVGSLG
jgi:hypothetical protein